MLKWWNKVIGISRWSLIVTWVAGIFGGAGAAILVLAFTLNDNAVLELNYDYSNRVLSISSSVLNSLPQLGYGLLGFSFALFVLVFIFVARFRREEK